MLGAGPRPATVSRSRRRDGGDGATVAWPSDQANPASMDLLWMLRLARTSDTKARLLEGFLALQLSSAVTLPSRSLPPPHKPRRSPTTTINS